MKYNLASAVELVRSEPLLLAPVWCLTIVMFSNIIISGNLPTGQFEDSILWDRACDLCNTELQNKMGKAPDSDGRRHILL